MKEPRTTSDKRKHQAFPKLTTEELDRLRVFGTPGSFREGEAIVRIGEPGHGLTLILSGHVDILGRDSSGRAHRIVTHQTGSFMGELAQISGRPALVDAIAVTDVEAVQISPEKLRSLLVLEADLGERIMRALILRRVGLLETGSGGPVIIGPDGHPDVRRLEGFLNRNSHPLHRLDTTTNPEAMVIVRGLGLGPLELPVVLCPNGDILRNPSEIQLARCLGILMPIDPDRVYDVAVVGAGPAGLATAVYAASEGLSVLVVDCIAFGGQAGASARIENYLGFPTGISGVALTSRAYNQAQKFGAEMAIPEEAVNLCTHVKGGFTLTLDNTEEVRARSIVVSTGAKYRRLRVPSLESFEAASVHYWATSVEARLCAGHEVVVVGGGNSAGQAVVYLARHAARVHLLHRRSALDHTMSRYLAERISALPNVVLVPLVEVDELEGHADGKMASVVWSNAVTGEQTRQAASHLFSFIGADPNTGWLHTSGIAREPRGFVLTGADAGTIEPLETSLRGVFAIGDARYGSVKRVAAAVGEGAQVVAAIHRHLARRPQHADAALEAIG